MPMAARGFTTTPLSLAKKGKKGGSEPAQSASSDQGPSFDRSALDSSCDTILKQLQKDLGDLKQGRTNPKILNNLRVSSDTLDKVPLSSLAAVTQRDPRTLLVTVYDPADVRAVQRTIQEANLNFNPQPVPKNDAQLAIALPRVTQEVRREQQAHMVKRAEAAKTQLRNTRADAMKAIKKSQTSEDERKRQEKEVTAVLEKHGKSIDQLLEQAKQALA